MNTADAMQVRESVRQAYSATAERPQEGAPFPTGRGLALGLGYSPELLDGLPAAAVDAFCGVSNVSVFADIPEGATILDLGCGAGLDTLIASRRVGSNGRLVGVDFGEAMLARARCAVEASGSGNVELRRGNAETLPVNNASIDVALVNGIFNLNPQRERIFCELARVVRPGGAVFAVELVLRQPLSDQERAGAADWFS